MNTKNIFHIFLAGIQLGTTLLEHRDPTMGIVYGEILEKEFSLSYDSLEKLFRQHDIALVFDYPDDKLLGSLSSEKITVLTPDNRVVSCNGNHITGMDGDGFYIELYQINRDFYDIEFSMIQ